jgi:hypothetical protein
MFQRTRWFTPAIIAGVFGATGALTAAPSPEQLDQQIQLLQKQVEELKTSQDLRPAAAATNKQAGDSSAAGNFTAGYKNGKFLIQSDDGKFSLSPNLQLQVRNVTNSRDNGGETTGENGFEIRRAKFGFTGNAYSKDLTYEFLWETSRSSGAVSMQDAWARYQFTPGWSVRLGQFKDPLGKEQTGSSKRLMAAERSLLNELLIGGDDYIQGISLGFAPEGGRLRGEAAFTDGSQQGNTNFRDVSGATPDTRPDYGVAGRFEFQAIGDKFKGYDDFTAMKQKQNMLVFGAGADFTQTGDSNLITYTADAQFENAHGLGLFGAVLGRNQSQFNAAGDSVNDFGFLVQASQMLGVTFAKAEWELFARYDQTDMDSARGAAFEDSVQEITLGLNGYFHGHNSKITLDATYLPNGSPVAQDGAGILQSDGDQFLFRAQYQLLL